MDVQQKPRFKNCCESCVWLGQFIEFDLCLCKQRSGTLPTVLARSPMATASTLILHSKAA